MRILASSVFEGVVYHCDALDTTNPCRPVLEVDALLRPGDADSGPLMVTCADYIRMAGPDARRCLAELAERGRIVTHLGVRHVTFPTWTRIEI
ncbi:MAG: hypothetical protein NVS3B21_15930 [Acidimicrobiales bacterium]